MASKLEMFVRRGIVITALLLAVGIGFLVYSRLTVGESARHVTFFEDALSIQGAYRKALGPHSPVVELIIEPDVVTAHIVVGAKNTQQFTFAQSTGFVVRGPAGAAVERDDVAFALSTVPFAEIPAVAADGARTLNAPPARLVVDREPGAATLRFRVYAADGSVSEVVRSPDR